MIYTINEKLWIKTGFLTPIIPLLGSSYRLELLGSTHSSPRPLFSQCIRVWDVCSCSWQLPSARSLSSTSLSKARLSFLLQWPSQQVAPTPATLGNLSTRLCSSVCACGWELLLCVCSPIWSLFETTFCARPVPLWPRALCQFHLHFPRLAAKINCYMQ